MSAVFEIRDKHANYELARDKESDVIREIKEARETSKFRDSLLDCKREIELLTAHHLRLSKGQDCIMLGQQEWICGRFNVCIPVVVNGIDGRPYQKVLMRCPMAHMLAETAYPGTVDEKMSCEVATYAYIQDNCPKIPIAHLFGFGFPDGRKFTHSAHLPFHQRLIRQIRRCLCSVLQWPIPSQYIHHPSPYSLDSGYVLLEYVESPTSSMLSNTWDQYRHDSVRRENLFRGISNIMLSLSRKSWPRIGSLAFYNNATIGLTNRPLSCTLIISENNGAKRVIERNQTFNTVEPYISDLFAYHDSRFLQQPNAVNDESDCSAQMATTSVMRAIAHHFFRPKLRHGPFRLCLTDDHQSQFLVDENWNITKVVDLEWVCSLPVQMFGPPYWLTGRGIDQLHDRNLDEYNEVRRQYMQILEEEERKLGSDASLSQLMESSWNDGTSWFAHCLTSVNAMFNLFEQHLRPMYSPSMLTRKVDGAVSSFFIRGAEKLIQRKVADKKRYDVELKELF